MKKEMVETICGWIFRFILLGGAIYGCLAGNKELSGGCITVLVLTFLFY